MEPVQVPEVAAPATPAPRSRRVLVVDDDPAIRDAMRHLLEAWGHVVPTAASPTKGPACALTADIDLLLTDYRLLQVRPASGGRCGRAALGREIEASSPATPATAGFWRGLRLLHKPLDEEELREFVIGRQRGQSKDVC
jgi:hypothetical protein